MGVNISSPPDLVCQGTYALTQCCPKPAKVKVGALGLISLDPGYYTYIGSAFGPGGAVTSPCRGPVTTPLASRLSSSVPRAHVGLGIVVPSAR